jgi:hypothetical protein
MDGTVTKSIEMHLLMPFLKGRLAEQGAGTGLETRGHQEQRKCGQQGGERQVVTVCHGDSS